MKRRRRLLSLIIPWLLVPGAFAQWVNISASNIRNGGKGLLSAGSFCVQPVDNSNRPLKSAAAGSGGGAITTEEECTPVLDGSLPGVWSVASTSSAGNMVPDPVIVSGFTTWSNPGAAWSITAGGGSLVGLNVLTVSSAATNTNQLSQSASIPVIPGQVYTLSGYVDASHVTAGNPVWQLTDGNHHFYSAVAQPGSLGRVQVQFTAPSGVTSLILQADTNSATISSGQTLSFGAPLLQAGFSQLADTSITTPLNMCYRVTVRNSSGAPVYTNPCYQPTSASSNSDACTTASGVTACNYDAYAPVAQPLTVTTAPAITAATATGLAAGATPTVAITGNPGTGYSMAFGIPAGPQGPAGPAGSLLTLSVNGTQLGTIVTLKVNGN